MDEIEKRVTIDGSLESMLTAENVRAQALEKLLLCLDARRSYYDVGAKKTLTEPDFKTISTVAIALLAYTDGKPIERKEVMVRTTSTLDELLKRAKESPAMRAAVRKLQNQLDLEDAETAST